MRTTSRPHVIVVHRWRECYAQYERYLDHRRHAVSYICTDVGVDGVPAAAADHRVVRHTDDLAEVRAAVHDLVGRWGRPVGIVALKEDDLLVGAALREEFGTPGPRVDEIRPFRDKSIMTATVAAAGLPLPGTAVVTGAEQIRTHAERVGWPVVLKPLAGSSSAGVRRLDGPGDLAGLPPLSEPLLAQQYVDLPLYHVDGVFDGQEIAVARASAYVNTCMSFRTGTALGSVEEDSPVLLRAITTAARGYLGALTTRPTVFHLELFVDESSGDCLFLEVGARVGGAEIPLIWREVHGLDLMSVACDLQLGRPLSRAVAGPATRTRTDLIAGWLLVPAPSERPCLITASTSMLELTPGPYAERVLRPGEVLPDADAYYEHVGGRFRFRARTRHEVELAIANVLDHVDVRGVPIRPDTDMSTRESADEVRAGGAAPR